MINKLFYKLPVTKLNILHPHMCNIRNLEGRLSRLQGHLLCLEYLFTDSMDPINQIKLYLGLPSQGRIELGFG